MYNFIDNLHEVGDETVIQREHNQLGTRYISGFDISGYTTSGNGSANSHAQISLSGGSIYYRGKTITIANTASPTANSYQQKLGSPAKLGRYVISNEGTYPEVGYVKGGPRYNSAAETDYPLFIDIATAAGPKYYPYASSNGTSATISSGQYVTSWVFASAIKYYSYGAPVFFVPAQNVHSTLAAAQSEKLSDLVTSSSYSEFIGQNPAPLYKLIFARDAGCTNYPKAKLVQVDDLRGMSFITKEMLNQPQKVTANSGTAIIADTINFVNTSSTTVSVNTSVYGIANVGITINNPIVTPPTTVSSLPSAATAGAGIC
jgi:hypothetical protein